MASALIRRQDRKTIVANFPNLDVLAVRLMIEATLNGPSDTFRVVTPDGKLENVEKTAILGITYEH